MKSELILLAFLLFAQAFSSSIYQTGSGVGVFSTKSHVLLANSDVGRSVDIEVQFEKAFDSQPLVALATSMIDMEAGAPNGYTTELVYVNEKGFKIRSHALSEKKIASLSYNWFATNDPNIHVEYVKTRDMGELQNDQAEGLREHSITVPIVNWAGKSPIVASFLMGIEFMQNGDTLSFKQQVIEVGEKNFKILMQSAPGSATVKNAKFCVVFSSQQHSYNTGEKGMKVKKDHPWIARESGESNVDVQFEIPSDIPSGNRVHLQGITGFDVSGEVRVVVNDINEQKDVAHLSYGTWGDSKLNEINYQAFYFSAEDNKVFDKDCAEVFSECNWGGNSAKVCDQMMKFSEFQFTIKSVHVPVGKSASFYNEQGFKGQKVKFTESVECLDMNAILLGEEAEEGVDLYEQEEFVEFSEEGAEYSDSSFEESYDDSEDNGESSSSSSSSEGEGYDVVSEEDGLDAVEKMHIFFGEEDDVSYEDSSSSGESGSYDTDGEESSEGSSSYSEGEGYDVAGEEDGLQAVEKMHIFLGEEDSVEFEESSSSVESGSYDTDGEESSESSSSDSEGESYDVSGEEDGLNVVEKMHIFLGEEDDVEFEESSSSVGSGSSESDGEESSEYSSSSSESDGYDVAGEEDGLEVVEKMHIFLGEEDSVEFGESDDASSFSEESDSSSGEDSYESGESSSSSSSEEGGYSVSGEDEEGASVSEEVEKDAE